MIKIKRIYDRPSKADGYRILVDRLWPRGILKDNAKLNLWLKEIAPSVKLRIWFSHDPKKWIKFQKKYGYELKKKQDILNKIKQIEKENKVLTLIYAAKDEKHNHAIVLYNFLRKN